MNVQAGTQADSQESVTTGPQAAPNPGALHAAVTMGPQAAPNPGALGTPVMDVATAVALLAEKDATIATLRRAAQDYESFMRILGHDLRNPLSSMLTAAELAGRRSRDDVVLRALSRIDTSGQRLLRMLDQLLDAARLRLRYRAGCR